MVQSPMEAFRHDLQNLKDQIIPLMKDDTDKFIVIAYNFIESRPKLLEATRASLYAEILKAAQMRIFIDGQEAGLAPFKGTVKLMVMYKGLLKLVRNSGELSSINAQVVYEADEFTYFIDEQGEHIRHTPKFIKERGKPVSTYCIARTKGNNEPYVEVMTEDEIQQCRKVSRAGDDSPWNGPFVDEMRKKTIIRRISKRLPMSTDLTVAINNDDALFNAPEPEENNIVEEKPKQSKMEQAMGIPAPAPATPTSPAPAPAAPAPEKDADIKKLEETFSSVIESTIDLIGAKSYPNEDPAKPARVRFWCRIKDKFYVTWSKSLYEKIEVIYNRKATAKITYVTKVNKSQQEYNDIMEVSEVVYQEDIPI